MISACQRSNDSWQLVPGKLLLRGIAAQDLEPRASGGDYLIAENERDVRSAAIRGLELRLETSASAVDDEAQPRKLVAELLGKNRRGQFGRVAHRHQIALRRRPGCGLPRLIHERNDAIHAHRPADGRRRTS